MKELIIGADGFIGRNLRRHLPDALTTSRRAGKGDFHFDLLKPCPLPFAAVAYLCAGVNGTLTVSDNPRGTWLANVDGTIWVSDYCRNNGIFLVWIGSTTTQWAMGPYADQKRYAECYLRTQSHVGIVRAGRCTQDNADGLCEAMIRVGREKHSGLVLWNQDEKPYRH